MINSPIRTVIANLSDKPITTPITTRLKLALSSKGMAGDKAELRGDVFTLIDRTVAANALMELVLDGKLTLSYEIDGAIAVGHNYGKAFMDSSADIQDRLTDLVCGYIERINEPVPPPEEPKQDEPKQEEKPVEVLNVEEPAKEEPVIVEPATVEEPKVDTPVVEPKQEEAKPEEPVKPARKPRQIKVN